MPNLKGSIVCKFLALFLCIFLAFEVSYLQAYQATEQLNEQLDSAKAAYLNEDFDGAKTTLENLVSSIAQLEGMDSFKGEVYLLLGAAYEKLDLTNLAIKYYCLAKDILGEGKTISLDEDTDLDLNSLTLYWSECMTASGMAISVLIIQYEDGYRAYLAGDYEGAKVILEKLVSSLARLEGFESLKGETYLVLGAAYEALKYKELAIKYYCMAIDILGVGGTVEGIRLSKLRWYNKCPSGAAAGRVVVRERRRGGGGFIGFILGLAILGGVVWYLFFSKNAPLKKLLEDFEDSINTATFVDCHGIEWSWKVSSEWKGSLGTVTFTPNDVPRPSDDNGYDDTLTYTLKIEGGGTLKSCIIELEKVVIKGRGYSKHTIWINNNQEFEEENTFPDTCSPPGSETYNDVWSKSYGKGTHSIPVRHKIVFGSSPSDGAINSKIKIKIK